MSEPIVQLQPFDEHNQKLQSNVHPSQWSNPQPKSDYHLVVIEAGTAGWVTAAGAAGLGANDKIAGATIVAEKCTT